MHIGEVAVGLSAAVERAGARALAHVPQHELVRYAQELSTLQHNGRDIPVLEAERILRHGRVVDVLGTPLQNQRTAGLSVALLDDGDARMLAMVRQGPGRDLAADAFFGDIARAAGLEEDVAPLVVSTDARTAVSQVIPVPTVESAGLRTPAAVDAALARDRVRFGDPAADAAADARVDRHLDAWLDYVTAHADRHRENIGIGDGRLFLWDNERIGADLLTTAAGSHSDLLHPALQDGAQLSTRGGHSGLPERFFTLDESARQHASTFDLAGAREAHLRLSRTPPPQRADATADWVRSPDYLDRLLRRADQSVVDGGWTYSYVPAFA